MMRNNYEFTKTLAEWSVANQIRFIYASSAATYGDGVNGMTDGTNDLNNLRPLNVYGYSKHLFDLYATRGKVLRRIIMPLALPGIVAGCMLVFIPALGAYVTPLILGGGTHLMIGDLIGQQFGSGRNWPFGCAQALILMAFVLVTLTLYVRLSGGKVQQHG